MNIQEKIVDCKTKDEIRECIDRGYNFIWCGHEELHNILNEIGKELNNQAKLKIKGCYEVILEKECYIIKDGNIVASFKKLTEAIDKLTELDYNDILVLTSNNFSELFKIYQQLVNLEKICKVYLENELERKEIVERFIKNQQKFIENINIVLTKLNEKKKVISRIKDESNYKKAEEVFNSLIETLQNIADSAKKVKIRPLKIGIFATKKAGKSMVVNCLLGEEYAPTSIELPTPNNIIYKPYDGDEIILEYQGEQKRFKSPGDLKAYLTKLFTQVSKEGKRLPDMTVYYPARDKTLTFEVIDTPGPDLAESEHRVVVYDALAESDIIIFVIDYSKYATESEVDLLKKLTSEVIEKCKKFNSFVIVLNKIDLAFLDANTEKIKLRITDFIYRKFYDHLKIDNMIVFPMSALFAFYLLKLREIFGEEICDSSNIRELLEEKYFMTDDSEIATMISQVQNLANSISKIFRVREIRYQDLWNFVGFEKFKNFIISVVLEKAFLDYVWQNIALIESYTKALENVIYTNIDKFLKASEKIKTYLETLKNDLEKIDKEHIQKIDNALKELEKSGKSPENVIDTLINKLNSIPTSVRESSKKLIDQIGENMKEIRHNIDLVTDGKISIDNLKKIIDKCINNIEKSSNEISNKVRHDLNNMIVEINRVEEIIKKNVENPLNNDFRGALSAYEKAIREFQTKVEKDYGVTVNIETPQLTLNVSMGRVLQLLREIKPNVNYTPLSIGNLDNYFEGGFWRWLKHLFGGKRYEVKQELYDKLNDYENKNINEVRRFESEIYYRLYSLKDELYKVKDTIREEVEENLRICKKYMSSIKETAINLSKLATMDLESLQLILQEFEAISNEGLKDLLSTWNLITKGDKDNVKKN